MEWHKVIPNENSSFFHLLLLFLQKNNSAKQSESQNLNYLLKKISVEKFCSPLPAAIFGKPGFFENEGC